MRDFVPAPSVFESFNARALEPDEVARTFIPSQHFFDLTKRRHSLIVGPRGSGKTTLLKMLQQPALEAWTHSESEKYRDRIQFTGVFVPTDIAWKEQLNSLGDGGLEEKHARVFSNAAFTTHALRSLITAFIYKVHSPESPRPHRRCALPLRAEIELARALRKKWYLEPGPPTLRGLGMSLEGRLSSIAEFAASETYRGADGRAKRIAKAKFLHLGFLNAAAFAVSLFEQHSGSRRQQWALLFDELELAPEWIRNDLVRAMRSTDHRFLFKLSMSPYSTEIPGFQVDDAPAEGDDFDAIELWYAHKEDGKEFCRRLFEAIFEDTDAPLKDPEVILGKSEFDSDPSELRTGAYKPGSKLQGTFAALAHQDPTFAHYLKRKNLQLHQLHLLTGDSRAAVVRKVAPLVTVRHAFRKPSGRTQSVGRTRKNPSEIYAGASSLFAMAEGNPRWLIGIVDKLKTKVRPQQLRIPADVQMREVVHTIRRFRALLRTIPRDPKHGSADSVLAVLDKIGAFFKHEVIWAPFNPDPHGSIFIDHGISDDLLQSLGHALNAGAIVSVTDDTKAVVTGDLRGRRFRLSYLLAPHYRLPIRLGRKINLSTILQSPHIRS